ncbi:alpha/beta hydrolase [Anaeromicropila populeti]|uniref:Putative esterase n=1 Tax=Anaeromicropila populeti TaxID=37658 RepID=A0A1I6I5W9_9FIRM|nr:alpha/beta hydrolase [Anaeromicropila populeti]SFR62125.1 Putative esterase [Anaeromicropila populeti]
MKRRLFLFTYFFIFSLLIGCKKNDSAVDSNTSEATEASGQPSESNTSSTPSASPAADEKHVQDVTLTSKLLSEATDGSSPEKHIILYLPPSYFRSEKRYPVVYYFHGFGDTPYYINLAEKDFEKNMKDSAEFIVVGVDGRTKGSNGSFYVNSPVTGAWEDYVIQEVIPYVDDNYRTLANPESRGITGFSMGGFAAINLALLHPEIFSSTLSLCPGLLKDDELQIAMDTWSGDTTFKTSYGQAFAPNPDAENLCDIPTMDGSKEDNEICEKWLSGFGHLEEKVNRYLEKKQPLHNIQIIYGKADGYTWIPEGSKYFSELLNEKGIEHTLTERLDGHLIPNDFVETYFVPFFSDGLVFEE